MKNWTKVGLNASCNILTEHTSTPAILYSLLPCFCCLCNDIRLDIFEFFFTNLHHLTRATFGKETNKIKNFEFPFNA